MVAPARADLLWLLGALGIVSAGYVFVAYRYRGLEPVEDVFVGATFDEAVDGELTIQQELPGKWAAIATAVIGAAGLATCVGFAIARSRRRGSVVPLRSSARRAPRPP